MAEPIDRDGSVSSAAGADSAGQLVREALDETRALVRLEVALAHEEIKTELARARVGAVALAAGAAAGLAGGTLCLVAIAASFSVAWLAALVLGIVVLSLGGAAALLGWRALPKRLMSETRQRFEIEVRQFKERAA